MITHYDLQEYGFKFIPETSEWEIDNIKITLENGYVTFVRERDNYHGLNICIANVPELSIFLHFIKS